MMSSLKLPRTHLPRRLVIEVPCPVKISPGFAVRTAPANSTASAMAAGLAERPWTIREWVSFRQFTLRRTPPLVGKME